MDNLWVYRARVRRIVDGDTIDLEVDLGFRVTRTIRVRLDGVDTAEIYGSRKDSAEYQRGIEHMTFVENWIATNNDGSAWPFVVRTFKDKTGKYGRYLAEISVPDGEILNHELIEEYPGVESDG